MKRAEFVLAYRLKSSSEHRFLCCLACNIYRGPPTDGKCSGLSCEHKPFNNNLHEAVITRRGCNFIECHADCNRCVMCLKFGVTRNL